MDYTVALSIDEYEGKRGVFLACEEQEFVTLLLKRASRVIPPHNVYRLGEGEYKGVLLEFHKDGDGSKAIAARKELRKMLRYALKRLSAGKPQSKGAGMEYRIELQDSEHDESKVINITCPSRSFTANVLKKATSQLEAYSLADRSNDKGEFAGVIVAFAEDKDGSIAKRSAGLLQKAAAAVLADEILGDAE